MRRVPRLMISRSDFATQSIEDGKRTRHSETLTPEQAHHLFSVLRASTGSPVELYDPASGVIAEATIESWNESTVHFESIIRSVSTELRCVVDLLIGTPKNDTADLIVEKCCELGVRSVGFFRAARSQPSGDPEKRLTRLQRIVASAVQQSESPHPTAIALFDTLKHALESITRLPSESTKLVLTPCRAEYEGLPEPLPFRQVLLDSSSNFGPLPDSIRPAEAAPRHRPSEPPVALEKMSQDADFTLIVGPEGGLTAEEVALTIESGFLPTSLGSTILRVETAAIVASGAIITLRDQK